MNIYELLIIGTFDAQVLELSELAKGLDTPIEFIGADIPEWELWV